MVPFVVYNGTKFKYAKFPSKNLAWKSCNWRELLQACSAKKYENLLVEVEIFTILEV